MRRRRRTTRRRGSEDTPLIVSATNGVLANDIDVEGDPLSLVTGSTGDFTTAQGGIIHFNADGSYIYSPAANFNGIDSVSYVVQDVHGATATATLNITVNAVNDAPAISGLQDVTVAEGQVGALIDTFTVSDVDTADGLSFRVLDGIGNVDPRFTVVAAGGTTFGQPGTYELRLAPGQSLSFVAENADGNPTITRTVEVNDQGGTNNIGTASITVTVEDQNDAPVITAPSSITIDEDTTFAFTGASAITVSDVDVGTDLLRVTIIVPSGSWGLGRGPFFSALMILSELNQFLSLLEFRPTANFSGQASITISVSDLGHNGAGGDMTHNKIITINVTPVNDAPAISGLQDATVTEGQVGALIDTFTVSDIDTANGLSFRVLDGIGNVDPRFTVVAASGTNSAGPAPTRCGSRPARA